MAGEIVKLIASTSGIRDARKAYNRLLQGPPPGGAFFQALLQLELVQQPPDVLPADTLQPLFEVHVLDEALTCPACKKKTSKPLCN